MGRTHKRVGQRHGLLDSSAGENCYGVEMTNLPLDKLSEQKEKKQRDKGTSTLTEKYQMSEMEAECVYTYRQLMHGILE